MGKIKLKPKARKGVIGIKALITHPMETGQRKKKGKLVPANHITHMTVSHNGNVVVDADIGATISKNPYFKFHIAGAKGDTIELTYKDNNGKTGSATAKSK
ncbi:Sulfur oxidation cycle carrier protein, SoxZ subunit [uncultured Gammaproteobacteria bacterium]|uniref:thiosulfate oxidation carrier complex protein SoxZ n=1 Tax=Bathymodiolus heckerae thiotrophic gill symbiont TaxID=1052212 RepID=UPI0010B6BE3A|nr:thiosulfate oxidation carrier complex protein SoxZ [Bathymodiolus heckerae thiotrophic gill symbiont]CAC9548467.1 Sulfur oxidation cycle carrier protein, SoxZ subunit [uncultured Gammaproteobacteria bacterium]CAC9580586.1 Sulfur oxidation cycle carrier protein, SoxZ subunit [uncultured Gammaproteobacteria bacterium]CAC9603819.1 Sulfur oxidation cycle carrier protein, SoxZ subunit [uncultured Gammaproteobacteria bacterium]CAC9954250.1 Sulfur oxidation cycle carrier protein, SoxZ subunit [uncu